MKISLALRIAVAALVLCAAGCVSLPKERGITFARDLVRERSDVAGKAGWGDVRSQDISKPLSVDDAVRVAFARSPKIASLYAELGISQAEVYDATHLSNPTLGYSRLDGNGDIKTTWSISQPITELLFLHYRSKLGASQLVQAQQRAAHDVLALEAEVREQYFKYVSAAAITGLQDDIADAEAVSARYSEKLYAAGNISALQLSRQQAAASEAHIEKHHAEVFKQQERVALFNLLGLPLAADVQFSDAMPAPGKIDLASETLQTWALKHRLDLLVAREAMELQQRTLRHTRLWRGQGNGQGLGEITVGAERETDRSKGRDGETIKGPSASLEVPLFNPGTGKKLRAQAEWERAQSHVSSLVLSISNDVAFRVSALQSAFDVVEIHRQQWVPVRERIVELEQQRQSFMLIGLPELLLAKREHRESERSYIESLRDYWLSMTQLQRALGGSPPELKIEAASGATP